MGAPSRSPIEFRETAAILGVVAWLGVPVQHATLPTHAEHGGEMQPPVDLDYIDTWPHGLVDAVRPTLPKIAAEIAATYAYSISGDRFFLPAPTTPATDSALSAIWEAMFDNDLRVFHATRLHEAHAVRNEGLRKLHIAERIAAVRAALLRLGKDGIAEDFDTAVDRFDLSHTEFLCREHKVYATPTRRLLHNGGSDIFFENLGGEAIERISLQGSATLQQTLSQLGIPAVVIFRIPSFRTCRRSESALPNCMLEIMLRRQGFLDRRPSYWDVLIEHDVPPDWIEAIVHRHDPSVAG